MPIDSRIALGYQPPQTESPVNLMLQMQQMQAGRQANALRQAQMENYQAEAARRNALLPFETAEAQSKAQTEELARLAKQQELANSRYNTFLTATSALSQKPNVSKQDVLSAADNLVTAGVLNREHADAMLANISDDPIELKAQLAQNARQRLKPDEIFTLFAPKPDKITAGGVTRVVDLNPNSSTYKQTVLDVEHTPTPGELLTDKRLRENGDGSAALSHDAMVNAATRYNIDGTIPPLGMGKGAAETRNAILSMAAELNKGVDPTDQRLRHISAKANASALAQLTKQETMVGAFEKNFTKNADLALDLNNKRDHTGIPVAQRWLNAGRKAIEGDPDLRKFDVALKAVVNEYSKIISGSMGNTQVALGEIKRMEDKLNSAQTPDEVKAVLDFMKLESANRMAGFKEQRDELTGAIAGKPKTPEPNRGKAGGAAGSDLAAAAAAELARRRAGKK